MVQNVAPLMAELEPEDCYLLSGIEHGMRFSKWVDRARLPEFSGLDRDEVAYRLDRCADRALIERKTIQYEGYRLRFEGYDILALRAFSERGTLESVGAPLGEGKESDVYEAKGDGLVAVKFHREGVTNFREVRRDRDYTADRAHTSWMYTARVAAEREFEALTELYGSAAVPEPIDHNRHAIVMERVDGVELSRAAIPDESVPPLLRAILDEIAAVTSLGYVHSDMSQYNIFVTEDGPVIFDWPQYIAFDHPNARELLRRDVENVLQFFFRKFPHLREQFPDLEAACEIVLPEHPPSTSSKSNK